jgi:hypothetical protein
MKTCKSRKSATVEVQNVHLTQFFSSSDTLRTELPLKFILSRTERIADLFFDKRGSDDIESTSRPDSRPDPDISIEGVNEDGGAWLPGSTPLPIKPTIREK